MYGSLAHTGISWPLYAIVGIIAAVTGKLLYWFRGK
ncbi:LPXTG cell wall anchor domain-containing protein [Streptomyces sp. WAC05374]|nr:LPXTG cell wall anchor domain-containing protein [Streptomyces sp. WAC05374]RST12657.1 LPXTG cell wall anchor domain-containing protein [Streptomyces sp. WAC05374]TDF47279.1 LPXTG cell wall anchor domain-containing protein [Streptomyces sp. WAC05374]TDF57537.1 LPXTG cell wall anchor domain-containing protein [Streptomyces sp. WAC05374]TDF61642.1 LPXTG cell wall anchor domain-containing protein [Streptomyces sp. WAC05374]